MGYSITCTNILLKKSSRYRHCSFYGLSREELEHLLFNCSFSQILWNDFTLSLKNIIVGVGSNSNDFLNYCILVGKILVENHCKSNNAKNQ